VFTDTVNSRTLNTGCPCPTGARERSIMYHDDDHAPVGSRAQRETYVCMTDDIQTAAEREERGTVPVATRIAPGSTSTKSNEKTQQRYS